MHYYQFNIGDYRAATAHLSNEEDLAYRRLLDMYYDTENQIPLDTQWVAKRLRLDCEVVESVLQDMFKLTELGWHHGRCETVIDQYHAMAEKNRANGRLGGRKKNPVTSDSQPIAKATINYKPLTINQEPIVEIKHDASVVLANSNQTAIQPKEKKTLATRLPKDFVFPKEWADFCVQQRPDLNIQNTFDSFKDYWVAAPKGTKLDWLATWRNWVRNQSAPKVNRFDVVTATTPPPPNQDAALRKIHEDDKKAVGPSLDTLARLAELRRKA